ncbi:PTS sugar transporter subunit IIB [Aerococcus urinaeequi]|uniref:PTS maltose transporter subunit IIBC n=1 Tax=Aerococcus urinaeequi TaxID=51665 RepID=A0AAC8X0F5_9LACT|nr:PTS sugar transporter subunit IIB [Aerococcus urinaeequi]AMB97627.1 PTS maltose transporter subunit IIBC [Aerococcus urinaeequi]
MMKIVTVCGNGIGSSLLLKMKVETIAKEVGVSAQVESSDSNAAAGQKADLFVTVKEFANIFPENSNVCIVKSYTNKKKIQEDLIPYLEKFK